MEATPTLEALNAQLAALERAADHDAAYALRAQIAEAYPADEAATCARYKMGIDRLFRGRDLVLAAQLFEEAAAGGHAFWSAAARTSLGLCLARLGRGQKGMLELRKVGYAAELTVHAPVALSFLEMLCVEAGQADEAQRVRADRIRQLEILVAREASGPPLELGHRLYQLGLALRDHQEPGRARDAWQRALAQGEPDLGAELFAQLGIALAEAP